MIVKALTVLLLTSLFAEAEAAIRTVDVETPRPFGYLIGDVFKHRIQITLDHSWELASDSLPEAGRISPWLERRIVRFDPQRVPEGTLYDLELAYQIFNAGKKPVEVFTPQLKLHAVNGPKQIPVFIHEWGFTVASVTRDGVQPSVDYLNLQPAIKPYPRDPTFGYGLLAAACGGLLFSLTALGVVYGVLPGIRRTQGPFARSVERLKVLQRAQLEPDIYRQALRLLHQAFNETAGGVLLGDDLEQFFSEQPRYEPLRGPIEYLFNRSRALFFGQDEIPDDGDIVALIRLCRQCRDVERGLL